MHQVFISLHCMVLLPDVNIFTLHVIISTCSAILLYNRVGACIGRWRWHCQSIEGWLVRV